MIRQFLFFFIPVVLTSPLSAQQFIGAGFGNVHIHQVPLNPAWTAMADNGMEINLASFSGVGGTNAYRLDRGFVANGFGGKAVEGDQYFRDLGHKKKHLWVNTDLIGPAVSFRINDATSLGFYSRLRQVVRGGNLSNEAFQFIGSNTAIKTDAAVSFADAGFTTHTFSEFGLSLGRVLNDDLYHILRGGVNVKYVIGMSAGSIYTPDARLAKSGPDTITSLTGEWNVLYSENIQPFIDNDASNDPSAWFERNGNKSIGIDIGLQYEYHPEGDPNKETPYLYSLAVAITDIGSVKYKADTGSGVYAFHITERKEWWQYSQNAYEPRVAYLERMMEDSLISRKSSPETFSISLPTALRVHFDWNFGNHFFIATHVVLNLKGNNGGVYKSGYVSMLSFTPRYETRALGIGLPVTYIGYQTMMIGLSGRIGPLFFGSSSVFSTLMGRQVRNLDAYAGLSFKIRNRKADY